MVIFHSYPAGWAVGDALDWAAWLLSLHMPSKTLRWQTTRQLSAIAWRGKYGVQMDQPSIEANLLKQRINLNRSLIRQKPSSYIVHVYPLSLSNHLSIYPILSYPIYPVLSYPILSYPILSCPVLSIHLSICIYIYVYVCICAYVHMCICVHVYMYICIYVYM